MQTQKVKTFYTEVRDILRAALEKHLRTRTTDHGEILVGKAKELPAKAVSEVVAELERIAADIKAAAESASTEQKAAFDVASTRLSNALQLVSRKLEDLFGTQEAVTPSVTPIKLPPPAEAPAPTPAPQPVPIVAVGSDEIEDAPDIDWNSIRDGAKYLYRRMTLPAGEGNWGWGRIFEERFVRGATAALLIDPYLDKKHQRRNLGEVIQWLKKNGPLARIHVITGRREDAEVAEGDQQLRELAAQLEVLGVNLTWERDPSHHDRFLVLSNGVMFEMGKGLDIYAMTRNLSETNPTLRRIKSYTTVTVLGSKEPK